jgi:small subunit ribosomal protein S2
MPRKKKTEGEEEKAEEKIEESAEVASEIKENAKEEIPKETKESENFLAPLEEYIKVSIHIGTRAVTPTMKEYVYRRKADGLAVLNTKKVDEKIGQGASFLAQYDIKDIIVCGKKEAAAKALEAFHDATGIRVFTKYPAGIITNPVLKNFFEPKLVFILDPWVDKNALNDAVKIKVPVMALCSTNNNTHNVDFVIPCNNKSMNSIGFVLYLLAKLYLEKRGMKEEAKKVKKDDFYSLDEQKASKEIRFKVEKEKLDMTAAREFIKKKLAEKKAHEGEEVKEEKTEKPKKEKKVKEKKEKKAKEKKE